MKIWITGADGQLGTQLASIIKDKYCELGKISKVYYDSEVIGTSKSIVDVSNLDQVAAFYQNGHFDIIFNCAAITNADAAEKNIEAAMSVNAIGARNFAIVTRNTNCKLIHISSDYVFNGDSIIPYSEWDACSPVNIYGKSKLFGEQYIREIAQRYFIVRTSWLYGYSGKNFVKTILKKTQKQGQLYVVNDQFGTPTNVEDLSYHLLKLALTEEYGVYHCTGKGACSWYDFACRIIKELEINCSVLPCSTAEYPRTAKRPAYSVLDNTMLRCTIGDEMRYWEDALKMYLKSMKG